MRIIAGTARGTVIDAPLGRDTRPTLDRVRENVFNILQQQVRGATGAGFVLRQRRNGV